MLNVVHVGNLPVFTQSAPALWIVAECGTFLAATGRGWERLDQDPAELVGRSIWEWAGEREDVQHLVALVLSGGSHEGTIEYGGHVWRVALRPVQHPRFGVVGVACEAYPIDRQDPPRDTPPEPSVEVWEAAGDNSRAHVWSGDRFIVKPDGPVQLVRQIPRAAFFEVRDADPTRLHLLHASGGRRLRAL